MDRRASELVSYLQQWVHNLKGWADGAAMHANAGTMENKTYCVSREQVDGAADGRDDEDRPPVAERSDENRWAAAAAAATSSAQVAFADRRPLPSPARMLVAVLMHLDSGPTLTFLPAWTSFC